MYGGTRTDTMTYNVSSGNDNVTLNAGQGEDTLTINKRGQNFTLVDNNGNVIFKTGDEGSTITVSSVEHITVIGDDGSTSIFTLSYPELSVNEGTLGSAIILTGSGFGTKKGKVLIGSAATKIITWGPSSIACEIKKPLAAGTYPIAVIRKEPKGVLPIPLPDAFTVMAPHIVSVDFSSGVSGDKRVLSGNYFGSKKGKVSLEDMRTGKKKNCKVTSWPMDANTGEITFVIPKGLVAGPYLLKVTNKTGTASVTFTIGL